MRVNLLYIFNIPPKRKLSKNFKFNLHRHSKFKKFFPYLLIVGEIQSEPTPLLTHPTYSKYQALKKSSPIYLNQYNVRYLATAV